MINPTSQTDSTLRLGTLASKSAQAKADAPASTATDTLSSSSQNTLKDILKSQPEVRPEVVNNGHKLAVDGNYPPREIIRRLSELLVRSVDLSE